MEPTGKKIMQTVAVGVIALAMCAVTVFVVQRNAVVPQASLANKLPSDSVVLFARINTMEQLAAMDGVLGLHQMLANPLPSIGSGSYEFAVLSQSGAMLWVLQSTTRNDSHVTGPAADMVIADGLPVKTLDRLPAFRRMRPRITPAVWMRSDILLQGASGAPDVLLAAMLEPYSHVMWYGGSPAVNLILKQKQEAGRPSGAIGVAPDGSLDVLEQGLGGHVAGWMSQLDARDPAMREGVSGIVTQRLRDALGADAADALAALAPNVSGIRAERGTGGLLYALALQDARGEDVDAVLEAFVSSLPQTSIRSIPLKKNERTDIAVDEDAVTRGEERVSGWRIRWAGLKDGSRVLAVADAGTRVLLSSDAGLVRRMIAETADKSTNPGMRTSGGVMDADLLDAVLADTLPMFRRDGGSRLWHLLPRHMRWMYIQQADADVFAIKEVTP